jgi:two-component system OmpR family sensor kinase
MPRRALNRWMQRRVVLTCGIAALTVMIAAFVAIFLEENAEYRQHLDVRLNQVAQTLLSVVEADPELKVGSHFSTSAPRAVDPEGTTQPHWQVWSRDGVLLLSNHGANDVRPIASLSHSGFVDVENAGNAYRAVSMQTRDKSFVVQVEEPDDGMFGGIDLLTHFHWAMPLAFLLIIGATWLMLRWTFQSVRRMADQLRDRDPLDPTRLDDEHPVEAMQPMANALNELFDRMAQATTAERSLSAAVAHEIRGSLAGIRAQAQLARTANEPGEMDEALGLLMSGVDRASRMLDQVFDLARVNGMNSDGEPLRQPVQVSDTYLDVKNELNAKAEAKGVVLSARFDADRVQAVPLAFYMLLRNLLENAVLYSPASGRIVVSTSTRKRELVLTVDDSGKGIPVQDRELAFERFNRLGRREALGVGLGLWIVKRIVELHGATIRLLDSPLGGLRVEVAFPLRNTPETPATHGFAQPVPSGT